MQAAIALGGNIGDVAATIHAAAEELDRDPHVRSLTLSSLYASSPVGADAGEPFINAAATFDSDLQPRELLDRLLTLEDRFGRQRDLHWGPRTLDLDLIACGDTILHEPRLILPHPHCWYRRFVLEPLAEIRPQLRHAVTGLTMIELRDWLREPSINLVLESETDVEAICEQVASQSTSVSVSTRVPEERVSQDTLPSIVIRLSDDPPVHQRPFTIHASPDGIVETVRDVLSAARGNVQRIP